MSSVKEHHGAPARTGGHTAVLVVTCLALATVVSAVASLNVAIPSIARTTQASQTQLAWIVDAYSLVFAALLLPSGALGDRFGRRRVLLAGLLVFAAASVAATLTSSPAMLIGLRGVLGLGASLVMPATLSTITSTFPRDQRARAVGSWAAVAGASAILGLLLSGALLEEWSWRSVFVTNIVLAVAAILGTLRFVPESAEPDAAHLDVVGALIAVLGLTVLVYSVIEAPDAGWGSARTLGGIVVALIVLAGFVFWELRVATPLLDPRLFTNRRFSAGAVSITLQFFGFFGFVFVGMQYMQLVRGDSALVAALSVVPMAVAMAPSARLSPRLAVRAGVRRCCVAGLVLMAGGLLVLSRLDVHSSYWLLVGGLVPLGAGMGLAMTPATSALTDALPAAQQGVGSAMNDLSRELGGALGIAVLSSVLGAGYRANLKLPGVPAATAAKARSTLAVAARAGGTVRAHALAAFVDGMHGALLCAAGAALCAAVAVFLLLRRVSTGVR